MADPAGTPGTQKRTHSRSRSLGGTVGGRPVSWDEMGELGLQRAVHEYYSLQAKKPASGGAPGGRGGVPRGGRRARQLLRRVLLMLLAPNLPVDLLGLVAAASWLLHAAAALLHATAVFTVPFALWVLFGGGDLQLRLPPAVAEAAKAVHPSLAAPLASGAVTLRKPDRAAALPLLLALWLAELLVQRRALQQWRKAAETDSAEEVESAHAGFLPPPSDDSPVALGAGAGSRGPADLLQHLANEVAALHEHVLGAEHRHSLGLLISAREVAAALAKLCEETGVAWTPEAEAGEPQALLQAVEAVKQAVGHEEQAEELAQ